MRAALKHAGLSATPENRFTVKVEPGTYELTRGLNIYSNTNFDLTGVTFIKANGFSGATMLKTGLADDVSKGYDYYKNITVIGGTFDAMPRQSNQTQAEFGQFIIRIISRSAAQH